MFLNCFPQLEFDWEISALWAERLSILQQTPIPNLLLTYEKGGVLNVIAIEVNCPIYFIDLTWVL